MKHFPILAAAIALASGWASAKPGEQFDPLSPADVAAIQAAVPAKATASPKQPRKVLVFYRTEGFVHKSIPFGNEALKKLGESTGAYTAVVSDDMAMFNPENLKQFDAVIFQNTTKLAFDKPEQRQALLDFVASGKGVAGIHAASDNFPTWPDGQALIGGLFHSHPWGAGDLVAVKLDEPSHPVNAGFGKEGFWLKEEIYQIVGPYGRDKQRVLTSLDMSKPANSRPPEKLVRKDNDFPISWVKPSGKGRVFYSSLGHNKDIFFVPQILLHFLDGIQYAIGDLAASDIPSASISKMPVVALAPQNFTTLQEKAAGALALADDSLKKLPSFDYGQSTNVPDAILAALRISSPAVRAKIEPRLAAMLNQEGTAAGARDEICRWLSWMGTDKSIPALVQLAGSKESGGSAVRALGTIPAPGADAALMKLLATAPDDLKVMAANALGLRRSVPAIFALGSAASKGTPDVAAAALNALAAIGSKDSMSAILAFKPAAEPFPALSEAIIACAGNLMRAGSKLPPAAIKALDVILGSDGSPAIRVTAARLLLQANPAAAAARMEPLLKAEDFRLRAGIARALSERLGSGALAGVPWESAPDAWLVMLTGVAEARRADALPLFKSALGSNDPAVQKAAVAGLGSLGDSVSFELLVPLLSGPSPEIAAAAAEALASTTYPGAGSKLLALHKSAATPAAKAVILGALANRLQREAFALAVADAASDDVTLRKASYDALARLAGGGDLPMLLPLLAKAPQANRAAIQKAVARATALDPNPAAAVEQLSASLPGADPAQAADIFKLLAAIDTPESGAKLTALLASGDLESRKQVIRALAAARNITAFPILLAAAEKGQDSTERILALRGFIDTIPVLEGRLIPQKLQDYRAAWKLATRDEEKTAIRDAVAKIDKPEAKRFLEETKPTPTPTPAPTPAAAAAAPQAEPAKPTNSL